MKTLALLGALGALAWLSLAHTPRMRGRPQPSAAGTTPQADRGYHTIPAYTVIPAPPTVDDKPKSGAWMYEGNTAVDLRTRPSALRH